MTDLTKPLRDVPVGAHVVHEGEAWEVWHTGPFGVGLAHLTGRRPQKPGPNFGPDEASTARVLHLDGNAPRPLAECVGRDVWDGAHWRWAGGAWEWTDRGTPRRLTIGSPCADEPLFWPILPRQPAADQPQDREEISRYYTSRARCGRLALTVDEASAAVCVAKERGQDVIRAQRCARCGLMHLHRKTTTEVSRG